MTDASHTAARRLRPMQADDIEAVYAMELRNYPFPWTLGIFRDCLRHGYQCFVLESAGDAVGYAVLQVVADEAHLLNICVDKPQQRQGHARHFLGLLMQLAQQQGARMMFLEVRPSNPRAIDLYVASGFHEIGRRRDYYDAGDKREDALVMARELLPPH